VFEEAEGDFEAFLDEFVVEARELNEPFSVASLGCY
jgi:hypothetical protein